MQTQTDPWQEGASPLPFANQMEGVSYLGPAVVVGADGSSYEIQLPNSAVVEAATAFSVPYRARLGDVLLVIGGGRGHWAIGVVQGAGTTDLALHGDVELRAIGGELKLSGDKGVAVRGPEVEIEASRLKVAAKTVHEKFGALHRRVVELFSTRVGRHHAIVDDDAVTTAKRSTMLAEETVTINGKAVMLG